MNPILIPEFTLADVVGPWRMEPTRLAALMEGFRTGAMPLRMLGTDPAPKSVASLMQSGKKTIAVLSVRGPMVKPVTWWGTSTVQLRNDIRAAVNNPDVSAILLSIDSPGGTVAGMDALISDVNQARRRKPVWSQIDDTGASAAYELAASTDAIFATGPNTIVGSIGTVMAVYDTSEMAANLGVKTHVFRTGPIKGAGMFDGDPLTQEQQDEFQRWVDGAQESFDAAVRKGRGLSAAELNDVRTGGIWMAPEAQRLRLIDGIQSMDKTLDRLAAAA